LKKKVVDFDKGYCAGVSIGVNKEKDLKRFCALQDVGAKLFTIDVAHGHHILVYEMLQLINEHRGKNTVIIAGNVATIEGAYCLKQWGADIIKIGIGPGLACTTRKKTGVGVPQLRALRDIRKSFPNIKLIADGGIRNDGDIAKALKYADAVMVGSYVAGTTETPGPVFQTVDGAFYKVYRGSASAESKSKGNNVRNVEGIAMEVPFRGEVEYILRTTRENLQSAFSYSGCSRLAEFQQRAILTAINATAQRESKLN